MLRKGIVERQIEALATTLAALLGIKKEGKIAETESALRKACHDLTGMDWNLVQTLTTDSLLTLLQSGGAFDGGKCLTLGVLLHEQGILDEERGLLPVAQTRYKKAFRLLSEALKREEILRTPEVQIRLTDIIRRITPPATPR